MKALVTLTVLVDAPMEMDEDDLTWAVREFIHQASAEMHLCECRVEQVLPLEDREFDVRCIHRDP